MAFITLKIASFAQMHGSVDLLKAIGGVGRMQDLDVDPPASPVHRHFKPDSDVRWPGSLRFLRARNLPDDVGHPVRRNATPCGYRVGFILAIGVCMYL